MALGKTWGKQWHGHFLHVYDLNLYVISKMYLLKLLKNTKNFTNEMQMEFVRNKCNNKMEKWAKDSLLL